VNPSFSPTSRPANTPTYKPSVSPSKEPTSSSQLVISDFSLSLLTNSSTVSDADKLAYQSAIASILNVESSQVNITATSIARRLEESQRELDATSKTLKLQFSISEMLYSTLEIDAQTRYNSLSDTLTTSASDGTLGSAITLAAAAVDAAGAASATVVSGSVTPIGYVAVITATPSPTATPTTSPTLSTGSTSSSSSTTLATYIPIVVAIAGVVVIGFFITIIYMIRKNRDKIVSQLEDADDIGISNRLDKTQQQKAEPQVAKNRSNIYMSTIAPINKSFSFTEDVRNIIRL